MASQTQTKIAGLPFISKKYSVVERGGKAYVTTKGRRRYKTPAKIRRKMASAARRIKIPILTLGAIGIPISTAIGNIGGLNSLFTQTGIQRFGGYMLGYYTGFNPNSSQKFDIRRMATGLAPLLVLMGINKSGVLKPINQKLAKMRVPLRLN